MLSTVRCRRKEVLGNERNASCNADSCHEGFASVLRGIALVRASRDASLVRGICRAGDTRETGFVENLYSARHFIRILKLVGYSFRMGVRLDWSEKGKCLLVIAKNNWC